MIIQEIYCVNLKERCVLKMLWELPSFAYNCILEMKQNEEMKLTNKDQINSNNATTRCLCNDCFTETNYKVRNRCHRTGKFREACHNQCTINY